MPGKQIISERTLLTWIIATVVFSIPLMLAGSLVVLGVYGCWPVGAYRGASGCLAQVQPTFLRFLPEFLGVVAGTVWTFRKRKAE